MIAEVLPGCYDGIGKRILRPKKRHPFQGRPMGAFLSQPLNVVCHDIQEVRNFLSTCRYVSDLEQFGLRDHWMRPEEFEQTKQGDCEDFALWAWRQLLALGYDARFVIGGQGRYGAGHAWITFQAQKRTFILEAQLARAGTTFPRLDTLRYKPWVSVAAIGGDIKFFEHAARTSEPRFLDVTPLVPEWLVFRVRIALRIALRLIRVESTAKMF